MRWKGNFFSSNSIGVVNPTEQVKNVIRNRETGHVEGGSQVKHVVKSLPRKNKLMVYFWICFSVNYLTLIGLQLLQKRQAPEATEVELTVDRDAGAKVIQRKALREVQTVLQEIFRVEMRNLTLASVVWSESKKKLIRSVKIPFSFKAPQTWCCWAGEANFSFALDEAAEGSSTSIGAEPVLSVVKDSIAAVTPESPEVPELGDRVGSFSTLLEKDLQNHSKIIHLN
jgi:hypothetical protein